MKPETKGFLGCFLLVIGALVSKLTDHEAWLIIFSIGALIMLCITLVFLLEEKNDNKE